jgi:phasin family protein
MNMNENIEMMTKAANTGYANLRRLAELNLSTWDRMVAKQMEMMSLCVDAGSRQYEVASDAKGMEELMGRQTEMARECGEKLIAKNREMLDLLATTRDEYQGWVEDSMSQVKDQFVQAGEAARTTARKAA